ncbi:MAG: hypothetical protein ACQEQ4_00075 [Fibrobacterota bacterium]
MNSKSLSIVIAAVVVFFIITHISISYAPLMHRPKMLVNEHFDMDFTASSARVTLGGDVVYDSIFLQDTAQNTVFVESLHIKSSLPQLFLLDRTLSRADDVTDFEGVLKRLSSLRMSGIRGEMPAFGEAVFSDGTLVFSRKDEDIRGELTMGAVSSSGYTIDSLSGNISGSLSDVEIQDMQIFAYGSGLDVTGGFSLEKGTFWGRIAADKMDVSTVFPGEEIQGRLSFSFELDTMDTRIAANPYRYTGFGEFAMVDFEEQDHPFFTRARREMQRLGIEKLAFQTVSGDVALRNGGVVSEKIYCDAKYVTLLLRGRYQPLSEYFNYAIEGFMEKEFEENVRPVIWEALLDDAEGDKKFYGEIRGDFDSYTVSIDMEIIKRGVRSFFRNMFN